VHLVNEDPAGLDGEGHVLAFLLAQLEDSLFLSRMESIAGVPGMNRVWPLAGRNLMFFAVFFPLTTTST